MGRLRRTQIVGLLATGEQFMGSRTTGDRVIWLAGRGERTALMATRASTLETTGGRGKWNASDKGGRVSGAGQDEYAWCFAGFDHDKCNICRLERKLKIWEGFDIEPDSDDWG